MCYPCRTMEAPRRRSSASWAGALAPCAREERHYPRETCVVGAGIDRPGRCRCQRRGRALSVSRRERCSCPSYPRPEGSSCQQKRRPVAARCPAPSRARTIRVLRATPRSLGGPARYHGQVASSCLACRLACTRFTPAAGRMALVGWPEGPGGLARRLWWAGHRALAGWPEGSGGLAIRLWWAGHKALAGWPEGGAALRNASESGRWERPRSRPARGSRLRRRTRRVL